MHVKKNDTVEILSGKDKGKKGKILRSFPRDMKVIVEGVNIRKVHEKSRKAGGKGQIIEKAMPIYASTVRLAK
jgi:large subunit ribosomal protein L24